MLTKEEVLAKINTIWEFETSSLLHDIPVPVREISSNTPTIYIPEEVLYEEDENEQNGFEIIDQIISELSSNIYVVNNEYFTLTNFENSDFYFPNSIIIDENFEWIMVSTIVFTGIGIAIFFGGEQFMKTIQEKLSMHKEYIGSW
ncbi:MAG: hypothetical protein AAF617_03475 [Bacteroidota bacterium]